MISHEGTKARRHEDLKNYFFDTSSLFFARRFTSLKKFFFSPLPPLSFLRAFVPSCLRVKIDSASHRLGALFLSTVILLTGCVPAIVPKTPAVSGHVYNARTKKPIAGAVVAFEGIHGISTVADAKGAFSLPAHTKLGLRPVLPFDALPCRTLLFIKHKDYLTYSDWVWLSKPTAGIEASLQPRK